MHWLLGVLHSVVGSWGISIMLVTIIVRLCLFLPSRRQQTINAHMSAQITALKPQIDKLNEKYKDDFMALSQAKRELFREAGINQFAQMGGCVLLLFQMPILMGLYFCLQESVFFRLEKFLWISNLSAPDMLGWWTEFVPIISTPWSRFGATNFLYLGPFFNILPLAAVALFYVQQKLTLPPPTDDIQAQQQAMMKYMLIFTALFFYKVAAGLCLYFIVSGLWSLLERRLVPKPDLSKAHAVANQSRSETTDEDKNNTKKNSQTTTEAKPLGFWGRMKERLEEAKKEAESSRQIRNSGTAPEANRNPTPKPSAGDRAMNRKKKKKGK
jgi:YidC/Oxa1 family membrane protein insertase